MLKRRERGKSASIGMKTAGGPLPFGHTPDAAKGIEGLEVGLFFLGDKDDDGAYMWY